VPELLPKDDTRLKTLQLPHRLLAPTLLAMIALHVLAVLKHRFLNRSKDNDILSRICDAQPNSREGAALGEHWRLRDSRATAGLSGAHCYR
jgi:hypothetical protein